MAESLHVDAARLVAFLKGKEALSPSEHEHVLNWENCMEAAVNVLLRRDDATSSA
jgi:hypothetical protein